METSKRYNSVPVKDNFALFAPIPNYRARTIRWCHLFMHDITRKKICALLEKKKKEVYPLTTLVAIATIQKLQNFALQPMESSKRYNSVPIRDNCELFAPTPYFWSRAI